MAADLEDLCKIGRQLFRQGKHAEAIQMFEQALQADPDRADAHDAIATAYFVAKQFDKAVEHFTRVTQLKPMDAKAYINLGAVFNRMEQFQKAADILKKAMSRDGKAVEAYYNLGIAYRGLKQPAMAINSYKEAIKINPRMLDAMQNLGNTYLEMNNLKSAIEQYKRALEINPDFERAKRGLVRRGTREQDQGRIQSLRTAGRSERVQASQSRRATQNNIPRGACRRPTGRPTTDGRSSIHLSTIVRAPSRQAARRSDAAQPRSATESKCVSQVSVRLERPVRSRLSEVSGLTNSVAAFGERPPVP